LISELKDQLAIGRNPPEKIIMDGNKQQKTIPTVYNMSSSKAREVLWTLEGAC